MIDLSLQKHSIRLSHQAQRGVSFFLTVNLGTPFPIESRFGPLLLPIAGKKP